MKLTKDQFTLLFREYMEEGGHSYDQWDIEVNWRGYQNNPETQLPITLYLKKKNENPTS